MDASHYYNYYAQQASQTGQGQYFAGPAFQRGYGIGGIFRSIFNFVKPAAKFVGKQILKSGANILSDVASGKNIKESAKERFSEAGSQIVNTAVEKVKNMSGGKALKRKAKSGKGHFQLKRLQRQTPDIFS